MNFVGQCDQNRKLSIFSNGVEKTQNNLKSSRRNVQKLFGL